MSLLKVCGFIVYVVSSFSGDGDMEGSCFLVKESQELHPGWVGGNDYDRWKSSESLSRVHYRSFCGVRSSPLHFISCVNEDIPSGFRLHIQFPSCDFLIVLLGRGEHTQTCTGSTPMTKDHSCWTEIEFRVTPDKHLRRYKASKHLNPSAISLTYQVKFLRLILANSNWCISFYFSAHII